MDWWLLLIKPGIDLVHSGLKQARKLLSKRQYQTLLSKVYRELLAEHPNRALLAAEIATLKAGPIAPSDLERVQELYSHLPRAPKPALKKAVKRAVAKRPAIKRPRVAATRPRPKATRTAPRPGSKAGADPAGSTNRSSKPATARFAAGRTLSSLVTTTGAASAVSGSPFSGKA